MTLVTIEIPADGEPVMRFMDPLDLGGADDGDVNAVPAESAEVLFWYSLDSDRPNEAATTWWRLLNPSGRGEPLTGAHHLCGTVVVTGRRDVDHPDDVPGEVLASMVMP